MSAQFLAASSQYIKNAATPVTAVPFTVGMWVHPTTTGAARTFFGLSNAAVSGNYFHFGQTAANTWTIETTGGAVASGTVTANQWAFLVARFITAANRRLGGLQFDGSTFSVQDTFSDTPATINTMTLGTILRNTPLNLFSGNIAEFWLTNTDIQPGGAQLQDALLRQLAYAGPFSVPHIAKDIVEYRSLRKYPSSEGDEEGEVFHGALGRQTWANVNGATVSHHPPLQYEYARPPGTQKPSLWQKLLRSQTLSQEPAPFVQPTMYLTQGTQRF